MEVYLSSTFEIFLNIEYHSTGKRNHHTPKYEDHFPSDPFACSHIMHRIRLDHPFPRVFQARSPSSCRSVEVRIDKRIWRGIVNSVCPSGTSRNATAPLPESVVFWNPRTSESYVPPFRVNHVRREDTDSSIITIQYHTSGTREETDQAQKKKQKMGHMISAQENNEQ